MTWETFDRRKSRPSDMTVSIFKTKKLALSKAVVEALKTSHVELLYDGNNNKMALKPLEENSTVSYEVKKSKRQDSWGISLIAFINHYGLDEIVGKRYAVVEEDGLFVVDLNNPISETRKTRRGKKEA